MNVLKQLSFALFMTMLFSFGASAASIKVGSSLPGLSISDKGEVLANGSFKNWSSSKKYGKKHVVIYMAGRVSAQKAIAPLTSALARTSKSKFHSTTLVNGADVTLGASSFALKEMQKNKKKHRHATLVFDAKGKGLRAWGLRKNSTAVAVLDAKGKVLFFKQGKPSAADVKKVIGLLK